MFIHFPAKVRLSAGSAKYISPFPKHSPAVPALCHSAKLKKHPRSEIAARVHLLMLCVASALCLDRTSDEDEHEEAKDGVELREHGEHHCGTECVVATTDG